MEIKNMEDKVAIYQSEDGSINIKARLEDETIWLTQTQMSELFSTDRSVLSKHVKNIIEEDELKEDATCAKFAQVQKEGNREVTRNITYYNLDMIISVGYRVKSKVATKFRKWATNTLRDYIVQGFAINDQRLKEKESQLETLKKAINLIERGLFNQIENIDQVRQLSSFLSEFAKGFELLDDYDHERLDKIGKTKTSEIIKKDEFLDMIQRMKQDFDSDVFGLPKDESFESSVNQIYQSFGGGECYSTVEEKAATLLYLVVKNHSFIDGNKRIAAACFLYFLNKNGILKENEKFILDNNTLFTLTILVAESKPSEMEIVKNMIVTILNRRSYE